MVKPIVTTLIHKPITSKHAADKYLGFYEYKRVTEHVLNDHMISFLGWYRGFSSKRPTVKVRCELISVGGSQIYYTM